MNRLKQLLKLITISLLGSSLFATANDLEIGYIDQVNVQEMVMLVDDQAVKLSRFTVVNDYGNSDVLLPLSSLRAGRIVGMELNYSDNPRLPTVTKVILIPDERTRQSLVDSQNKD